MDKVYVPGRSVLNHSRKLEKVGGVNKRFYPLLLWLFCVHYMQSQGRFILEAHEYNTLSTSSSPPPSTQVFIAGLLTLHVYCAFECPILLASSVIWRGFNTYSDIISYKEKVKIKWWVWIEIYFRCLFLPHNSFTVEFVFVFVHTHTTVEVATIGVWKFWRKISWWQHWSQRVENYCCLVNYSLGRPLKGMGDTGWTRWGGVPPPLRCWKG